MCKKVGEDVKETESTSTLDSLTSSPAIRNQLQVENLELIQSIAAVQNEAEASRQELLDIENREKQLAMELKLMRQTLASKRHRRKRLTLSK